MRILYVANRAEVFSGGQRSLLELLWGLDRSRFEPIVLCPGEGELAKRIRAMDMKVHIWQMPTARSLNIAMMLKKIRELRSIIKEQRADIVHPNGSRAQFYASLAVKKTGARLIWHIRESIRDFYFYDWFLGRSAERIICVSRSVQKERFGRYPGFHSKIRVIYNGVDIHKFVRDDRGRRSIRENLNIGDDNALLGIIALLIPRKGHPVLFKALKLLIEKHPKLRLIVLGKTVDRVYTGRLKKMIQEMKMREKVFFVENNDDIKTVLSALDIFVLPSRKEGFSRVLLEAMACSVPIVASDIGGNNEAIVDGESGFLITYGDIPRLAEAIERLISDTGNARRIGKNARKRVKEKFSIEKHVSSVQKLYEEVKGQQRCV